MSDHIQTSAQRRAQIRRQKIMSESDNRMKRILSINDNKSDSKDVTNDAIEQKTELSAQEIQQTWKCGQNERQSDHWLNEEPEVRHRFNGHSTEADMESIDRTFPRKVSLISTPIDYKTLQQSHQNNATSLASHLVWVLCQNQTRLSAIGLLLTMATFASIFRLNFLLPFGFTQLFRLVLSRSLKHNGSTKASNKISIVSSVLHQLTVFVFTYITVQIFV